MANTLPPKEDLLLVILFFKSTYESAYIVIFSFSLSLSL